MTTDAGNRIAKKADVYTAEDGSGVYVLSGEVDGLSKSNDSLYIGDAPQESKRDVSELLKLDTFQGMTDAEIQSLIDYYVNLAKSDDEATAVKAAAQSMAETANTAVANAMTDAQTVLDTIINSVTNYQGVKPTSVDGFLTSISEV